MSTPTTAKLPGISTGPKITVYSSPRERFQSVASNLSGHQAMVDNPFFDHGATVALAEFVTNLSRQAKDPNGAMGVGFKVAGAVEFLQTFKSLAEPGKPAPQHFDRDNLIQTEPQRRP